jgi:hypothetical protein
VISELRLTLQQKIYNSKQRNGQIIQNKKPRKKQGEEKLEAN